MQKVIFSCVKKILVLGALFLSAGWFAALVWVWYGDVRITRRPVGSIEAADSAVVLSTKVHLQGQLNPCLVSRVEAGVALWRAGKVKRLVMSGGINRDFHYGSKTMKILAERMGVPAEAVVLESESADTYQNIIYSTELVKNDHSVVLVSSGFHLRRASWLAARQWPDKHIQVFSGSYCYSDIGFYLYDLIRETGAILKNGLLNRY